MLVLGELLLVLGQLCHEAASGHGSPAVPWCRSRQRMDGQLMLGLCQLILVVRQLILVL